MILIPVAILALTIWLEREDLIHTFNDCFKKGEVAMRAFSVTFRPKVWFKITREELDYLLECSRHHYDLKCQRQSMVGGFLCGFNNMMDTDVEAAVGLDSRDLDTLAKIVEMDRSNPINLEIGAMLRRAIDLTPAEIEVPAI